MVQHFYQHVIPQMYMIPREKQNIVRKNKKTNEAQEIEPHHFIRIHYIIHP